MLEEGQKEEITNTLRESLDPNQERDLMDKVVKET